MRELIAFTISIIIIIISVVSSCCTSLLNIRVRVIKSVIVKRTNLFVTFTRLEAFMVVVFVFVVVLVVVAVVDVVAGSERNEAAFMSARPQVYHQAGFPVAPP